MSAATRKGTAFESLIAGFLRVRLGNDLIERRAKSGTKDRGDLTGIKTIRGGRVVVELKNHKRHELAVWLDEAEVERGNDDAAVGVVVFKRRGTTDPAEQYVLMTVEAFARLLEGGPSEYAPVVVLDTHTRQEVA